MLSVAAPDVSSAYEPQMEMVGFTFTIMIAFKC